MGIFLSRAFHFLHNLIIIRWVTQNRDAAMVLGRSSEERDPTLSNIENTVNCLKSS